MREHYGRSRKVCRGAVALLCAATLLAFDPVTVDADLYTGGTLSVEWLVDSADEIFHVQLVADSDKAGGVALRVQKSLKGNVAIGELQRLLDEQPSSMYRIRQTETAVTRLQFCDVRIPGRWFAACRALPQDEWYLFAREEAGHALPLHVFYVMNLTRPREFSSVAAVTSSGEVLETKHKVTAAVEKRLALKRQLPKTCQRYLIDRWNTDGISNWADTTRRRNWLWSAAEVASVRGGFDVPIEVGYWDHPEGFDADEDLLLLTVIVPATPEFYPLLLQQFDPIRRGIGTWTVYALLNYPGRQTETILENLIKQDGGNSQIAKRVLTHLRYRENLTDPLNEKLIGRWNLYGRQERVELDFRADHSCVVNTIPVKPGAATPRPLNGRGYWAVHEGRLWVSRGQIQRGEQWAPALRQFFAPKKILRSDDRIVVLEGGPRMARPD